MHALELGRDLGHLAAALRSSPDANARDMEQAAGRLRDTRPDLDEAAFEQLARVAQLPLSLVDPWLDDTLARLDEGDTAGSVPRMETMERAWTPVADSWPLAVEQATVEQWQRG